MVGQKLAEMKANVANAAAGRASDTAGGKAEALQAAAGEQFSVGKMFGHISEQFGGRRRMRKRSRSSHCRKKKRRACKSMKNCKFVSKKRRFCRKAKNTRRRRHRGGNNEADVQAPDVQAPGVQAPEGPTVGGSRRGGARRGGSRRGGARRGDDDDLGPHA